MCTHKYVYGYTLPPLFPIEHNFRKNYNILHRNSSEWNVVLLFIFFIFPFPVTAIVHSSTSKEIFPVVSSSLFQGLESPCHNLPASFYWIPSIPSSYEAALNVEKTIKDAIITWSACLVLSFKKSLFLMQPLTIIYVYQMHSFYWVMLCWKLSVPGETSFY